MHSFADKVCIITGAANGLGKALATELYKQGAHLVLIDTDANGLESLRKTLKNNRQKIAVHVADISDEAIITTVAQAVQNQYQRADVLINNAGISISQPFDHMNSADHRRLFEVNYWGTVYCTKHFLPVLKNSPGSRLVNIISGFALTGFPGKTAYASSKAAVMGFTAALRTELVNTSVKTSVVIPPPLATNIVNNGKHINSDKQQAENKFLEQNGMPLEKAAVKIVGGIKAGRYRIIVGRTMYWSDLAARLFPSFLNRFIARKHFPFT